MTMTIVIITGHCKQDKLQKISSQGQHRIARTGYPGQDNRTAPVARMLIVQLKQSGKLLLVHKNGTVYCTVCLDRTP